MSVVAVMRAVERRLPGITYNRAQPLNLRRLETLLAPGAKVLVVGAGTGGRLLEGFDVVTTDIRPLPGIDVVCDAQNLPFGDASVDAVIAIAVLEHVADPVRVVDEIRRVLKPGGLVYSEIPFLQRVHAGAWDFTRYTALGHRRLFRWFDTIRLEAISGPGSAVAWAIEGLLLAAFGRRRLTWVLTERAAPLLLWWLPKLDRFLLASPGGSDTACATAFLGRLRTEPVDDADVLAAYSGACPTPVADGGVPAAAADTLLQRFP